MTVGRLRSVLVQLLALPQLIAQALTEISRGHECAVIDTQQSNVWKDTATEEDHFSLRLTAVHWVETLEVRIEWAQDVQIDDVYEAETIDGGDGGRTLTVQPTGQANEFVVAGRGSLSKHPNVICSAMSLSSTTDAAATGDCDLGAHYLVDNEWQEGANVEVRFETWEYNRVFSMVFDEEVEALNPLHGTLEEQSLEAGQTVMKFKLGVPEGAQPCSTGHLDAYGNPERDTDCAQAHPQNSPQKFYCQIMPPPVGIPRIICQAGRSVPPVPPSSPPYGSPVEGQTLRFPPAPSPPPSPKPPPPPSPRPKTLADRACPLGGHATLLYALRSGDGRETLRIVVHSNNMRQDHSFVLGFVGLHLNISYVSGASLAADASPLEADVAREFTFVPTPGASSFAFNVQGMHAQLSFLTCSPIADELESRSPPPARSSYSYDEELAASTSDPLETKQHANEDDADDRSNLAIVGFILIVVGGTGGLIWYRRHLQAEVHGQRVGSRRLTTTDEIPTCEMCNKDDQSDATRSAKGWSIALELGSESYELDLAFSAATNPAELKHAIIEASLSQLGPEITPMSWLNGRLETMAVQFIDVEGEAHTMLQSTEMDRLRSSHMLRVTQRTSR